MKGLPFSIRMKLLESDPTPDLAKMVSFAQRFRALDELPAGPTASCAAVHHAASDPAVPRPDSHLIPDHLIQHPHELQQQRLDKLELLVSNMADQQANFIAAVSSLSAGSTSPSPFNSGAYPAKNGIRCFYCHEEGHIVKNCTRRHDANRCTTCRGWGHSPQNCANNYNQNTHSNPQLQGRKFEYSLNSRRVPR